MSILETIGVQYGTDPRFHKVILPGKSRPVVKSLWVPDKVIAEHMHCSTRIVYRWRKSHGWMKYRADNYVRPKRSMNAA